MVPREVSVRRPIAELFAKISTGWKKNLVVEKVCLTTRVVEAEP